MTLSDVEALLYLAAEISNHRRFVVAGSLVAIGAMVRPPADMVRSRGLDLYPQLDPKRSVEAITLQLGQGSTFHRTNGFYANPIAPARLALPSDWQTRLAPISLAGGVVACFIDPNDAAIGKLMRGVDNDLRWVRAGLAEGVLNAGVILERSRQVLSAMAEELAALQAHLQQIERNHDAGQDGSCAP